MSVPAAAVPGPVLVIARSAHRCAVVFAVAVLLAALVSSAVLLAVPGAPIATLVPYTALFRSRAPILKLTLAPLASVPTVHVTTFGAVWLHPDDTSEEHTSALHAHVNLLPLHLHGTKMVTVTV